MKSQVLYTVSYDITGEAAGEIWTWSMSESGSERVKKYEYARCAAITKTPQISCDIPQEQLAVDATGLRCGQRSSEDGRGAAGVRRPRGSHGQNEGEPLCRWAALYLAITKSCEGLGPNRYRKGAWDILEVLSDWAGVTPWKWRSTCADLQRSIYLGWALMMKHWVKGGGGGGVEGCLPFLRGGANENWGWNVQGANYFWKWLCLFTRSEGPRAILVGFSVSQSCHYTMNLRLTLCSCAELYLGWGLVVTKHWAVNKGRQSNGTPWEKGIADVSSVVPSSERMRW